MMYEFSTTVNTLEDYKEEDGWPLFIDEFVEFLRKKWSNIKLKNINSHFKELWDKTPIL